MGREEIGSPCGKQQPSVSGSERRQPKTAIGEAKNR